MKKYLRVFLCTIVFLIAFAVTIFASAGSGSVNVVVDADATSSNTTSNITSTIVTPPSGGGGKSWYERYTRAQDILKAQEKDKIILPVPESESGSDIAGLDKGGTSIPKSISERGITKIAENGLYIVLSIASFLLLFQIIFIIKDFLRS